MGSFYIIAIGMLVGIIVVFSVDLMLWASFTLSMFVYGLAVMASPSLGSLQWAIAMVSVIMLVVVVSRLMLGQTVDIGRRHSSLTLFYIFVAFTVISAGVNIYPKEWIGAAKNYFQFWSVPLVYYYILKNEKMPARISLAMLLLAMVEPVIAATQYIILRGHTFIGDRIGGTFGGGIDVVGGNAELAMFQVTQMLVVFALAKNKLIKLRTAVFLSVWFLLPMYWTSTKAIVLMIPVGFMVLYLREMRARPAVFIGVMLVAFGFSSLLAVAYYNSNSNYVKNQKYGAKTFDAFLQQSIAYNVDDNGDTDLNRTSAIIYWWEQNGTQRPLKTLFGYGLGAAKNTGQTIGHLYNNPKYQYLGLGITFLSRLLWEVGLFGTIVYIGIFYKLFRLAGQLSRNMNIPLRHRTFLSGYQATILIFIISIPYKKSLVFSQAFEAYAMFVVGYVLFWYRYQKQINQVKPENDVASNGVESRQCLHIIKK